MTEYVIKTEDVTLEATHVETDPSEINNRTRGTTASFDLSLEPLDSLAVESGDSYTIPSGQTEVYGSVDNDGTITIDGTLVVHGTVDNDGTINNNGTLTITGSINQKNELLAFDRHAGSYSLSSTLNNTQKYKERLPTNSNVSSLVIGLEPRNDLENKDIAGKWGLVSNITDNRNRPITNDVITLEINILADLSEYSDVASVQNDLEI